MMNNAAHLAAMTRNQNAMTDDDSGHSDEDAGSDMDMNEDHKGVWSGGSQCSPNSNTSQGSTNGFTVNCDGMGNDSNSVANASDAEGVWSPDIEQAFQEAMQIYPPCGRRKIILSDEGRMYGRNELIARYIKLRTGKTRTRKQVSSHIQVLARKRSRELQAKLKDHGAKKQAINSLNNLSSAQIVNLHNKTMNVASMGITLPNGLFNPLTAGLWSTTGSEALTGFSPPSTVSAIASSIQNQVPSDCIDVKAFSPLTFQMNQRSNNSDATLTRFPGVTLPLASARSLAPPWEERTLCTQKLRLCELSAYFLPNPSMPSHHHEMVRIDSSSITYNDPLLETIDITQIFDKFPTGKDGLRDFYQRSPESGYFLVKFWADMSFKCADEQAAVFAVDSRFESTENFTISVSTKVCSFGKQVVEKVEHEYPKFESGRFVYCIQRSPMCEYMNNFIHKLRKLPERHLMNSVLENFTILQIVSNKETQEILLCLAFVFEISDGDGPQNRMYKLNYFPMQHSNK